MTTKSKSAEAPLKITTPRPTRKSQAPSSPASAKPKATPPTSKKSPTKRDQLSALLVRDKGATIDQMIAATGWLPHTVRAAMTGLKKLGYAIDSDKIDGLRTYRAVEPR